jgi:hypothetical protein
MTVVFFLAVAFGEKMGSCCFSSSNEVIKLPNFDHSRSLTVNKNEEGMDCYHHNLLNLIKTIVHLSC